MPIVDTEFIFKHHPELNRNVVAEAFDLCKDKDRAVFMADLIIKTHLGAKLVLAAILMDVSANKIKIHFGSEIAELVVLAKKSTQVNIPVFLKKEYDEDVATMLVALVEDLRVLFLFLVYTIYLLEFRDNFDRIEIKRILRFAVPLAYRLNVWHIKTRLEDLCLQRLSPEKYIWIERKLNRAKNQREAYMNVCLETLKELFEKNDLKIQISGRVKNIYSIYKKIELRNVDFEEIYDLIAFRIVVSSVDECYKALGIVHNQWLPHVERIKDYIAIPKPNNYRALHTTVMGPENQYIEIQIRTNEMDREANFGIAAHWTYAKNKRSTIEKTKQSRWIKSLLNLQTEKSTLELDNMRIPFYQNNVFVFTGKGRLFRLPKNATPIDLAFLKSTYTGYHLKAVRINNKAASLTQPLQNTDLVELILDKKPQPAQKEWLKSVKTEKALLKITAVLDN